MSYHEHNKESSGWKIIQLLKEGAKIALISDAGLPTISDPGSELVAEAIEEQPSGCTSSRSECCSYSPYCIRSFN